VSEDEVNFDAIEALEVAKKYMCQLDKNSIVTMCNNLENELQIDI